LSHIPLSSGDNISPKFVSSHKEYFVFLHSHHPTCPFFSSASSHQSIEINFNIFSSFLPESIQTLSPDIFALYSDPPCKRTHVGFFPSIFHFFLFSFSPSLLIFTSFQPVLMPLLNPLPPYFSLSSPVLPILTIRCVPVTQSHNPLARIFLAFASSTPVLWFVPVTSCPLFPLCSASLTPRHFALMPPVNDN